MNPDLSHTELSNEFPTQRESHLPVANKDL